MVLTQSCKRYVLLCATATKSKSLLHHVCVSMLLVQQQVLSWWPRLFAL
jgi:hypothetical protein